MEQRWELTAASAGQKLGAIALGAVNLVGVVALTFMLQVRPWGPEVLVNGRGVQAAGCAAMPSTCAQLLLLAFVLYGP